MAKTIHKAIWAFLALILLFFSCSICGGAAFGAPASAATSVLEDLQRDESFNLDNYPEKLNDYSLNVIQIAESAEGELFIYVYQPAARVKKIVARYLNMSLSTTADNTKQYNLTLLNSQDVFQKYVVEGFEVSSEETRYYNISNILRPFDSEIDEEPAEGQTVTYLPNKVGQLWTLQTVNGQTTYAMLTSEVITITQKYVGYCIYDDGLQLGWGMSEEKTKAYFVAFDTDRPIDKLISADLIFFATSIKCKICAHTEEHGHKYLYDFHDEKYIDYGTGIYNNTPLTITHTQKFSNQGGGNIRPANRYTWNRIRTTKEFLADNKNKDYQLASAGEDNIANTKWVLNFYETQDKIKVDNYWLNFSLLSRYTGVTDADCELNNVYDVEILRLEFETDGVTYNLGVIDNKQTGGNDPINYEVEKDIFDLLASIFNISRGQAKLIFAIILLVIFAPLLAVLGYLIPPFGKVLLWLLNGLWWLICAPYRGIAALIRKRKATSKKGSKSKRDKGKNNGKGKTRTSKKAAGKRGEK